MSDQIVIKSVGPPTSRSFEFDNATPLVMEAETPDGVIRLVRSPRAVSVLAEEIPIYKGKYWR